MNNEQEKISSQTEYNLNAIKTNIIGNQISRATHLYYIKDYLSCFQTWKSIRLLISNRLDSEEMKGG